ARSETSAISNEAALEAYRQSPAVVAQQWLAQPTACEFCRALDGKIVGLNETYARIGQTIEGLGLDGKPSGQFMSVNYENLGHPPMHPQCQCTVIPVTNAGVI